MRIPVVIGPHIESGQDPTTPHGSPSSPSQDFGKAEDHTIWDEAEDWEAHTENSPWLPATSQEQIENCKSQCIFYKFGGFCVRDGQARFYQGTASGLRAALRESNGATSYVYNGANMF